MNKNKRILLLLTVFAIIAIVYSCNKNKDKETILEGNTSILVDETLMPIVEDQVMVFESQYKAKIKLIPKSENEAVLDFSENKANIVILPRELNSKEQDFFKQKKIVPRSTPFAIDGITFIKSKKSSDTLLAISDVVDFLKGKQNGIKGLVFDNPNSSTVERICQVAGISELPKENVYSFKTNEEVIKYVSENDGMIGVVGLNWVAQPKSNSKQYVDNVNVMSVKGIGAKQYVYPSQENLGAGIYPLARVLFIINCQGYDGLGIGFTSFIAGDTGQRIVGSSGLAPLRIPAYNIRIRNQIENDKK